MYASLVIWYVNVVNVEFEDTHQIDIIKQNDMINDGYDENIFVFVHVHKHVYINMYSRL